LRGGLAFSEENRALREKIAAAREAQTKSDRKRKREIVGLREKQDEGRADLTRFTEELVRIRKNKRGQTLSASTVELREVNLT
jgi:hypothetical protein